MAKYNFASVFILSLLFVACDQKMPSTHEIHYRKDMKDSIVFVNYNISADSSCNFYMDYPRFKQLYKTEAYESVYAYHLKHLKEGNDSIYLSYRRKEFYSNNNPDSAEYYQSGGSSENHSDNDGSLKPTIPYKQPSRPYYYKK
jgi:hypothetical protein